MGDRKGGNGLAVTKTDDRVKDAENSSHRSDDTDVRIEPESDKKENLKCCYRNLDMCCGDSVRGCRDCCCCLGRASKEVYRGCHRLECKDWIKKTFTVNSARKKFPVSLWLPKYRPKFLLGDVIAGFTVALTALPQGLAYAKIALLPPQYGLYSLFMPCYTYLFFGSSKDVSIGPTAVMSLLTSEFAESPIAGDPTYAIVLAMMCGIIQFLMGVLHLGFLVDYISHPVVHAFTMASVVTIISSQIPNWLGLQDIPRDFIHQVYEIFRKLPETQLYDFLLGLVCMIFLFLMKKMKSTTCMVSKTDSKIVRTARYCVWLLSIARNAIVVMSAAGLAAILLMYGHEPFSLTGDIPAGLPPFKPPSFSVSDGNSTYNAEDIFKTIGTGLVVVPLISFVETIAVGKSFARINKYKIEPNQELLALGVGNLLGSFVSGYPVTGSFSRTSVNCQSGCKSPGAGFWTGTVVLLVIAFLTPVFYYIPDAALAAIIIMALLDVADFTLLIELWDVKKIDLIPWFFTFVFSLLLGVDNGVLIGIVASLCILLYPPARPKIKTVSDDTDFKKYELTPQVEYAILELNQGLTFPSAEHFIKHVHKGMMTGGTSLYRSVVLDFSHVTAVDTTIVRSIEQLSEDFTAAGEKLVFCQVQSQVMKVLKKANLKHVHYVSSISEGVDIIKETAKRATEESKLAIMSNSTIVSEKDVIELDELSDADVKAKKDLWSSPSLSSSNTTADKLSDIDNSYDDTCDINYCQF